MQIIVANFLQKLKKEANIYGMDCDTVKTVCLYFKEICLKLVRHLTDLPIYS